MHGWMEFRTGVDADFNMELLIGSRKMLQNEDLLAKIGVDVAETEPSKAYARAPGPGIAPHSEPARTCSLYISACVHFPFSQNCVATWTPCRALESSSIACVSLNEND